MQIERINRLLVGVVSCEAAVLAAATHRPYLALILLALGGFIIFKAAYSASVEPEVIELTEDNLVAEEKV